MAHLETGRLNLGQLREATRRLLLKCLDECPGSKAIIWDDKLTGRVGLIAEYSLLKEHDVGKMFPLPRGSLPSCDEQNIIYLVRPKVETMDIIAENVHREEVGRGNSAKKYHIYFVPRGSIQCQRRLEEKGCYGNFEHIGDLDLGLIPFDNDVMSLEHEKAFAECYSEGDLSSMYHVASSLMKIQGLYGIIHRINGKGDMAKRVTDMILDKRKLLASQSQFTPLIDQLILIDRSVDLLTPLLTQLTYEGLVDAMFNIENTSCQLPPDKFPPKEDPKQKTGQADTGKAKAKKILLNSSENLFSKIRDMNFSAVGSVLSKNAKDITAGYEEHRGLTTVGQIKDFVHKLPHMQAAKQALSLHTSIAECIKEHTDSDEFRDSLTVEQEFFNGIDTDKPHPYIEQCMAIKEPITKVLRLVCLQCFVNNGFKLKLFNQYKQEIIQNYGFEHLITWSALEKTGLLKLSGARTYPILRKSLRLVVEDVQEQNPNDIAYVHSGYAPLSVRLVQFLERQSGWRGMEELLKNIPGHTVEEKQDIPPALVKKDSSKQAQQTNSSKLTLVYFLGGCTYSEIAALRFLSQQENATADYIIATTKILSGKNLLESLMNDVVVNPVHY